MRGWYKLFPTWTHREEEIISARSCARLLVPSQKDHSGYLLSRFYSEKADNNLLPFYKSVRCILSRYNKFLTSYYSLKYNIYYIKLVPLDPYQSTYLWLKTCIRKWHISRVTIGRSISSIDNLCSTWPSWRLVTWYSFTL